MASQHSPCHYLAALPWRPGATSRGRKHQAPATFALPNEGLLTRLALWALRSSIVKELSGTAVPGRWRRKPQNVTHFFRKCFELSSRRLPPSSSWNTVWFARVQQTSGFAPPGLHSCATHGLPDSWLYCLHLLTPSSLFCVYTNPFSISQLPCWRLQSGTIPLMTRMGAPPLMSLLPVDLLQPRYLYLSRIMSHMNLDSCAPAKSPLGFQTHPNTLKTLPLLVCGLCPTFRKDTTLKQNQAIILSVWKGNLH